ncbi:hypothetical protein B0H19DRAFT_1151639 [Mycena capillaripes]|nr:hypothetical protein B0H19DRAFT_1151639 [Mycena capillaripes]
MLLMFLRILISCIAKALFICMLCSSAIRSCVKNIWSSAESADFLNSASCCVMVVGNLHRIWIFDSLGFLKRRKK